jgi:hypothetical protein
MNATNGKSGMLGKLALAAGLLGATALGVATAAPLGPQASLESNGDLVTHVKKKGKGKGGKNHHHHNHGLGVGVIVLGTGIAYCAAQSAACEESYGEGTGGYWRCMRRAGCDW